MKLPLLSEIFDVLKRVLKTSGLTYLDLANHIGPSEPTIKRYSLIEIASSVVCWKFDYASLSE